MNKGQSLFEVVLALSIISLIIFGVVILATASIGNSDFSRNKALATRFSQEATEWLRGQRDANWITFLANSDVAGKAWCLNSEPIIGWGTQGVCASASFIGTTIFKREVTLTTIVVNSVNAVEAKTKVYWNDSKGYHEINSVTDFTNFRAK